MDGMRPRSTHEIITSSLNPNWRTPDWLYHALDGEFGFILDCAAQASDSKCPDWLGPGGVIDDALCGVPWWDLAAAVYQGSIPLQRRALFVNPPSSRKTYEQTRDRSMLIESWLPVIAEAGQRGTVAAILPYSPQTEWWRSYVESDHPGGRATEVRKFPFRVAFDPPAGYEGDATGSNINQVVVIWKPTSAFAGPWAPLCRYWIPAELGAAEGRGPALPQGTGEGQAQPVRRRRQAPHAARRHRANRNGA